MPIDLNGTLITGGTSVIAKDSSNNNIYQQLSTGEVMMPTTSEGAPLMPLFNVGWANVNAWSAINGVVPFAYTGGSGYFNVGGCYNTGNYRFTAPWTGLYFFKQHIYIYGNNATVGWYTHPLFLVNGSRSTRRPGGIPYRMRLYGLPANYGYDTDCCEQIYLTAGDYVQVEQPSAGTVEGYQSYSAWSGAYLGN
jgi:hypothetical protein